MGNFETQTSTMENPKMKIDNALLGLEHLEERWELDKMIANMWNLTKETTKGKDLEGIWTYPTHDWKDTLKSFLIDWKTYIVHVSATPIFYKKKKIPFSVNFRVLDTVRPNKKRKVNYETKDSLLLDPHEDIASFFATTHFDEDQQEYTWNIKADNINEFKQHLQTITDFLIKK